MTTEQYIYYVLALGNVIYSTVNLFLEPKQKDFPAMVRIFV